MDYWKSLENTDGFTHSTRLDAFFSNFAEMSQVVLSDTLLKTLNDEQILAVVAHEIGHGQKKRSRIVFWLSNLFLVGAIVLLVSLHRYTPAHEAFGIETPSIGTTLLIFLLIVYPFRFLLNPVWLMRESEYQADAFAVLNIEDSEVFIQALKILEQKNLGNLWVHPWYSFFYYSHPVTLDRIRTIRVLSSASSEK